MRCLPLFALLLATTVAHAEPTVTPLARTCGEVAEDGLDPQTRARAREALVLVLERADLFVVDRDCTDVYRIQHAPHGDLVVLIGPGARVSTNAPDRSQLGSVYADLLERQRRARAQTEADAAATTREAAARAAAARQAPGGEAPVSDAQFAEEPIADASPSVAPAPDVATAEEEPHDTYSEQTPVVPEPSPDEPRSTFYLDGGFGAVHVRDSDGKGLALGFGLRLPAGPVAMDVSLRLIADTAVAGKLEILSNPQQGRVSAGYVGAGISVTHVSDASNSATGAAAEFSAGMTVSASHRTFVQADLTLPFFNVAGTYPAMFALAVGHGF